MAGYRDLKAWQVAHQLTVAVDEATRHFPKHERFELTSQLRRAALWAPTNLVEGRARFGSAEYLRFVRIAAASLAEVDYLLLRAHEQGYLAKSDYEKLEAMRRSASFLVHRLARALDRRLK